MPARSELQRIAGYDAELVAIARTIKVLSRLSWPAESQHRFLADWQRGRGRLPQVPEYVNDDLDDKIMALGSLCRRLQEEQGPLGVFLHRTAESYRTLCRLLQQAGTPDMLEHSIALYGCPSDPLSGGALTNHHAALHFLEVSREYYQRSRLVEAEYCLSAQQLQSEMSPRLEEVFDPGVIRIDIDPEMASKAAAGATRIRLRDATCFSEYDLEQLLQHEAFVHSLTAQNGREQTHLQTLSLGAPRTTGTQEGLATFAELVTGSIDISRMERIAFRVIAIQMALDGADFVDVFRYFVEAGQVEIESFNSAMRVFRGAPLTGGAAFTKDAVYLHGLMEIHTFFRWAMLHQKLRLCRYLFAGRMTVSDVIDLEPCFEDQTLAEPRYLPPWMTRTNGLAAYLAFSVFANRITLSELGESHRFDRIADMGL